MVPPQHPYVSANLHSATSHITTFLNYYDSDQQIHTVLFTIRLCDMLRTHTRQLDDHIAAPFHRTPKNINAHVLLHYLFLGFKFSFCISNGKMPFMLPNRYAEFNSVSDKWDNTGGSLLIHYTLWR